MPTSRNTGKELLPAKRPLFCYITDRHQLGRTSLPSMLRTWIAKGVDLIQIREKDLSDRDLFEITRTAVRLARQSHCRILLNGRADIAFAAGAHGAHLPSKGLLPSDLRLWLPRDFILGVSAHSLREAHVAAESGASYIVLGPVFSTPSKLRFGIPLGLRYLAKVTKKVPVPILAVGGIHPELVQSILSTGVAGIAGISLFQRDLDPTSRATERLVTLGKKV